MIGRSLIFILVAGVSGFASGCALVTTMWGPPAGFVPLSERPRSPP